MSRSAYAHADLAGLVVIGASAGGVQTLRRVVAGLPVDLPAAVCVVLHVAPRSPSALAGILARAGNLPCRAASGVDELVAGEVLVAPPDHHLVVEGDVARLTTAPAENGHRPAVNVLFRSAAVAWGDRVVGVVLTGNRDDGTIGLAAVKDAGGAAVVQDPEEALYGSMPASALARVQVDAVARSASIAAVVVRLVNDRATVHAQSCGESAGSSSASSPESFPAWTGNR